MSAFALFRSCTTSLSSRTLAREAATLRSGRCIANTRRFYSQKDESAESPNAVEEEAAETEGDGVKEGASEGAQELTALKTKLEETEAKVTDLISQLRYSKAEYQNLHRNTARELEQSKTFAINRFASNLLETVDVLSLALKSVPSSVLSTDAESSTSTLEPPASSDKPLKTAQQYLTELHQGVEMTQRQLLQTLFQYHIKPFDPVGEKFDPNRMEALYQVPIPDKEPGTVLDCQKTGYMIKDRVLRAAQVGVVQESS